MRKDRVAQLIGVGDRRPAKETPVPFQVKALRREPFEALFELTDQQLTAHRAVRVFAEDAAGFPERISLTNAQPGDELLLVNFEHQDAESPYRSSHAVYVGKSAAPADLAPNTLAPYFESRAISLRAFNIKGMIVGADLITDEGAAPAIEALLANEETAYIHAHFAKFGCFAARIERV